MYFNLPQHALGQIRGDVRLDQSLLPKKFHVDIFCHRHPEQIVCWGCIESDCESMIMCNECDRLNPNHVKQHSNQIVEFDKFLDIIALEIKKVNRADSALYNLNIKQVLENDHKLQTQFEKRCQTQIRTFITQIDGQIDKIIQNFTRLKQQVQVFFERQTNQFRNNSLHFKAQYQQLNPVETSERYGDGTFIGTRLLMKSPFQCFTFLRNLRKSANMEGQLLTDLNYLSSKFLTIANDKQYFIADFVMSTIEQNVQDMLLTTKQLVIDQLKDVPSLDNAQASHSNAITHSYTSFSRHQIRLQQPELFDNLKNYAFKAVGQMQTHHNNSVSALVALSDEVLATSSYDRTIKIWRSNGELLKTLYDKNCVSCLIVFKMFNDRNPQADQFTDDDTSRINMSLLNDLQKNISDSGLLLVSGGFDREIKVWDFNLIPSATPQEPQKNLSFSQLGQQTLNNNSLLSQPYHLSDFPLRALNGHVSWVTALCSLEDQKNVVSGDDTGEIIVWDVINGILFLRIPYIKNPCMMPFIALIHPFKTFCCSSSSIIRLYSTQYQNSSNNQEEDFTIKDRLSRKFNHIKEQVTQYSPELVGIQIKREIDIGWTVSGCISPYNYRDQGLLIVFGGVPKKLKYVQLDRGRQIEIQGDWSSYVGCMILLEKFQVKEKQMDQFYKNFNLIVCGDKQLGLFDGYGNHLKSLKTEGSDDLYGSNLLCQRNMQVLKLIKKGSHRILRLAVVSQYTTDQHTYQSGRITYFELQTDILNFQ